MENKNKKKKSIFFIKNMFIFFIISIIILVSFLIFRNNINMRSPIKKFIRNPLMFYIISLLILRIFVPFLNITGAIAFNILLIGLFISLIYPQFFDFLWAIITSPFYIYNNTPDAKKLITDHTAVSNLTTVGEDQTVVQDNIPGYGLGDMDHARAIATSLDLQAETLADSDSTTPGQQCNAPEIVAMDMIVDAIKKTVKAVLPKEPVDASNNTAEAVPPEKPMDASHYIEFASENPETFCGGGSNK